MVKLLKERKRVRTMKYLFTYQNCHNSYMFAVPSILKEKMVRGSPSVKPSCGWGLINQSIYDIVQCFSTALTRPDTGTWRPP